MRRRDVGDVPAASVHPETEQRLASCDGMTVERRYLNRSGQTDTVFPVRFDRGYGVCAMHWHECADLRTKTKAWEVGSSTSTGRIVRRPLNSEDPTRGKHEINVVHHAFAKLTTEAMKVSRHQHGRRGPKITGLLHDLPDSFRSSHGLRFVACGPVHDCRRTTVNRRSARQAGVWTPRVASTMIRGAFREVRTSSEGPRT